MKLDFLVEKLIAAAVAPDERIFLFALPAEVSEGVMLKTPLAGIHVDHDLPGFYRAQIQVIVRAQSHARGDAIAAAVLAALKNERRESAPGFGLLIHYMLPITLPIVYPRSDGNGLEWSLNFETCYVMA